MRRLLLGICAAALITAQAIGCGGSDQEASTISKAAFIAQGNRACAKAIESQEATLKRLKGEVAGQQLTSAEITEKRNELVDEIVASIRALVDELEELGSPGGEETRVAAILEEYGAGADKVEESDRAYFYDRVFENPNEMASQIGLRDCKGL